MEQYNVMGMSCAACSARVEKAVLKVDGVTSCAVSLLTNSMGVEGTADSAAIIRAVENAGYGASLKKHGKEGRALENGEKGAQNAADPLADRETPVLKRRLLVSLAFLLVLMYFSMGHLMWGFPLPAFFDGNHIAMGLTQLLLAAIIMIVNQKFFISGFKSLLRGAPNMDTLVALGAAAAFIYSTYVLFAMTDAAAKGDADAVMTYMHDFYFESAAMILTLITVGKMLEARSKGKTTDALKALMKLAPKTAVVLRDGKETEIPIGELSQGDLFVVRPGENIPADGVVTDGTGAVNEAALTGESVPVDKQAGDSVSAATLNQSGFLTCRATRVGEDTTLSQIIQMVSDAAATKAPIAKIADKVSGIFVPTVIAISLLTMLVWFLLGETPGFILARGISVLVISCPCALGLATPVAIMVGNGVGAKNGIMFKTAASLETTGKTEIVALDKTGTITEGAPRVTDMVPADDVSEETLLSLAASLEAHSEHPLSRAVMDYATERGVSLSEVTEFTALPGNGLTASSAEGERLAGGNLRFITSAQGAVVPEKLRTAAERLSAEGKTPLYFAKNDSLLGMIAVADVLKADGAQAVRELQGMGLRVVMLTGDNERTAGAIGAQAGVDEVIAGVLPDGKESVIRTLQEQGKVAMVGDGINDAPALTRADVGVAIGAGTDIAIDAADVVLMKSRLRDVPAAIRLSRATLRNIRENLFWAFFYNVIGIPLAAGVWIPIFGWKLNPMFGAAAMSLSSFCVVTNALRLNFFRPYDTSRDRANIRSAKAARTNAPQRLAADLNAAGASAAGKQQKQEENTMQKTMKIEGMMCAHCEARVKKALEALGEVTEAKVSHESGEAVVTLSAEIPDETLRKAVEEQEYTVLSVA